MAKYSVPFSKGADNVTQLVEVLSSATVQRTKWYDLSFACTTTPADATFIYRAQRMTATGTGTSVTPSPIDLQDAASGATAEDACTIDGTFTANLILLQVPLNHRASFRWVAAPGSELVGPATSAAGIGLRLSAASTNTFAGVVYFEE